MAVHVTADSALTADECAPPPAGQIYSIPSEWDQVVGNGAICLLGMCRSVEAAQPYGY